MSFKEEPGGVGTAVEIGNVDVGRIVEVGAEVVIIGRRVELTARTRWTRAPEASALRAKSVAVVHFVVME